MSEQITEIKAYEGAAPSWGREAGFQVVTTEQTITLAIDDDASCCETWGYFLTEDDADKFVGAELRAVEITDTNLSNRTFTRSWMPDEDKDAVYIEDGDTLFVNLKTDRGTLQFVAYNAHNGYYGHEARVSARQLQHTVTL